MLKSRFIARAFPFQKKAILLLSYPRSGSSWLGEVLSHSPDIAYLREPVTQAVMQELNCYALIYPDKDRETYRNYKKNADNAFIGIPPRDINNVVFQPEDFSFRSRNQKRLLIKEVNPMAVDFYLKRYSPILLLLIRHPAAIADSFARMGWLSSGWHLFGLEYGKRMHNAIKSYSKSILKILLFEDLAKNPKEEVLAIHEFLKIEAYKDFDKLIERYTQHRQIRPNPYQTERESTREIDKWKNNLSPQVIQEIREGYLESDLPYYRDNIDW